MTRVWVVCKGTPSLQGRGWGLGRGRDEGQTLRCGSGREGRGCPSPPLPLGEVDAVLPRKDRVRVWVRVWVRVRARSPWRAQRVHQRRLSAEDRGEGPASACRPNRALRTTYRAPRPLTGTNRTRPS